jgi:hypothetical protein
VAKTKGESAPLSSPAPAFRRGVQELGALIPRLARPAFRRRSPAAAQILADWPQIMGPEHAAMAEPVKLTRTTLTLACTGPAAMELHMAAPVLMERINAHLGRKAVEKLAFIQRAPNRAPPAKPLALPPPAPLPESTAARLDALPEGELKAVLERLAARVHARRADGRD